MAADQPRSGTAANLTPSHRAARVVRQSAIIGPAGGQPPEDVRKHVKRTEMSSSRLNHHGRAGDPVGQPPGVAGRGEDIARAVPEQDRHRNCGRVKPPRRAERQRIIDPAIVRRAQRLGVGLDQHRPYAPVLAQASDWPFILRTGTSPDYARKRVQDHLLRFTRIYEQLATAQPDQEWLKQIEWRDNIFPDVDYRYWA